MPYDSRSGVLQGEDVIADCHGHLIRSACGNLLAMAEKSPEQVQTEAIADELPFADRILVGLTFAPVPQTEAPSDTPIQSGPPIITPVDAPFSPGVPILAASLADRAHRSDPL